MFCKKIKFVFLIFFLTSSLCVADGVMWGEKNIRVIQTEWFDIIYSEGSKESAALLAENADRIYYEIAEMYGTKPQAKMPVVLSPKREVENAYFSVQFYNHIVIYDTAPVEELDVFSNNLLSTFRHELTHAFSYNMKNKFWTGFDNVFGEVVNPGGLFITLGWAEGATLTSESVNGEGRLNDEYSKHVVKQAKLENQFPAYADVQGASDKHPIGAYYNFNGAFNEWLQKKYGMEKYAQFWYKCVNFKTFTTHGAFRKVYGIKIEQAWKQFKESLPVPQTPPNPLDFDKFQITDFFSGNENSYSTKNKSGAVFKSVTVSQNSIAWLEEKSGGVFIVSKDEAQKEKPCVKKLFCVNGAQKISLSQDGRFLAISYVNQQTPTYTCRLKIYDLQKKKWIHCKGNGTANAAIVQSGGEYFIVSLQFYSQNKKIAIAPLYDKTQTQTEIPLAINDGAFDFCDIGNGNFAFIRHTGLEYSICIANLQGKIISETKLPHERMVIKNLSFDSIANKIYFSHTIPQSQNQLGTMPRLGEFDIAQKTFVCDKNDVSGGIFYPVKLAENEFFYVGKFFRQNRLFRLKICDKNSDMNFIANNLSQSQTNVSQITAGESQELLSQVVAPQTEEIITLSKPAAEILADSKKYNPFKYFKKGLFLPIGIVPSYSFDPREVNFDTTRYLWFGATYITNNPWNSNTFMASAGYNPFTNSGGLLLFASGGTDDSLFKWKTQAQTEFDFDGWKQSDVSENISVAFPFGKISALVLSENANVFVGRGNNIEYKYDGKTLKVNTRPYKWFPTQTNQREVFYANANAALYYSNIHLSGEGAFEKAGVAVGAAFLYEAAFDLKNYDSYHDSAKELAPFVQVAIPKLIPIECKNFFVYNLPLNLNFQLFDSNEHFLTASVDAVLFAMDIQKAIPILTAIFIDQFYFSAGYSISTLRKKSSFGIAKTPEFARDFFNGNFLYNDYIHFDGTLAVTPNFGILANPIFRTEFKLQTRYYFNRPEDLNSNWKILFGINTNISF